MKKTERMAILMFLHSRNETSESEERELAVWRKKSPDNERFFRNWDNPEYIRKTMAALYERRETEFENLKTIFPGMAKLELSSSPEFEPDPETDAAEEAYRIDFPEKPLAESGLSKVEFWGAVLAGGVYLNAKPVRKKPVRYLRSFLRVAAVLLVTFVIYQLIPKSKPRRFEASFLSSTSTVDVMADDMERGFLAGDANISFEENEKGETINVYPDHPKKPRDFFYKQATKNAHELILRLPDSSQIWVNAESVIRYSANFSQDTIQLEIEGEAYFELASNTRHHYVVSSTANGRRPSTDDIQLEVQGARFSISCYPNDTAVRVSMIQGSGLIQLKVSDTSAGRPLLAGQQATVSPGSINTSLIPDSVQLLSLKNGNLYFKDSDIHSILRVLARWYDLDVQYDKPLPSGKFSLEVPLETEISVILDRLNKQGAHLVMLGKTITVIN